MIPKIYIVCNSVLSNKLRTIPAFKLNLGVSLIDSKTKSVNTADVIIQKHHMHYAQIIQMLGFIGSLQVYSHPSHPINTLWICSDEHKIEHEIGDKPIYDEINIGLELMFTKLGLNKPVVKEENIEIKEKKYVKPNKPFKEFTEAERLAYARSLK